jgi:hypothetical protein
MCLNCHKYWHVILQIIHILLITRQIQTLHLRREGKRNWLLWLGQILLWQTLQNHQRRCKELSSWLDTLEHSVAIGLLGKSEAFPTTPFSWLRILCRLSWGWALPERFSGSPLPSKSNVQEKWLCQGRFFNAYRNVKISSRSSPYLEKDLLDLPHSVIDQ